MRRALLRPSLRALAAAALAAAALALGTGHAQAPRARDGVTVTFLANEGVMLSAGGKHVLVDALYREYKSYALPADSTRAALEGARSPFDSVDLILVTHHHGDHFHPASVAAHLRANPRATLVTSQQVIDSLRGRLRAGAVSASRILARTTPPGARRREVVNGVAVELLGLPHGGHPGVEHLGYVVEIGGRRVLHVGDTDGSEATFAPFRLDTARIDVALLPYGMVTSRQGRRLIARWIRPRQVVAFHVGWDEAKLVATTVRIAMPDAVTFARSLETRRW